MIELIISGGQTGADRGALDAAIKMGVPHGGWCPRGRRAEDGRIPDRYQLSETTSSRYERRTACNVEDADGTLILLGAKWTPGSRKTKRIADVSGTPCFALGSANFTGSEKKRAWAVECVLGWLAENSIRILNVAGTRESKAPGIQAATERFIREVIRLGRTT